MCTDQLLHYFSVLTEWWFLYARPFLPRLQLMFLEFGRVSCQEVARNGTQPFRCMMLARSFLWVRRLWVWWWAWEPGGGWWGWVPTSPALHTGTHGTGCSASCPEDADVVVWWGFSASRKVWPSSGTGELVLDEFVTALRVLQKILLLSRLVDVSSFILNCS